MTLKFSLAISHTPWIEERKASFRRLEDSLILPGSIGFPYAVFDERMANHEWSGKMWAWSASQDDVEWCVFLQDDAVVAPDFFERLTAIVTRGELVYGANDEIIGTTIPQAGLRGCRRFDVIGLQVAHPAAPALAAEGYRGFTTNDGLVGVGYAVKRTALKEFLRWRAEGLNGDAGVRITEDSLLGLWCAVSGTGVYHPIPTIVDHDTAIVSTYDNGSHPNRNSRVRWDTPRANVTAQDRIPHMGNFYAMTPALAKEAVKGIDPKTLSHLAGDNGHRELRRLTYSRRANVGPARAKVFIATPTRGGVSPSYAASIWRILQDEEIDVEGTLELSDVQLWGEDVVRIRSRFVSHFLNKTDATHLLFIDSDIEVLPKVIRGMLAADKDFVAAPYPRRDGVDFKRVRENPSIPAEGVAYRYSLRMTGELNVGEDGCAEVEGMPLGCALIKREALQKAYDAFEPVLGFDEDAHGVSVALFQLILKDRALLSEDYSFCERWRTMGKKVFMFLGDGSPVTHHGEHRYEGNLGAFGLRRSTL